MSENILSVKHRHSDLKKSEPDLILEVGKPIPRFYADGRPHGIKVMTIEEGDPLRCILENGELIMIGRKSISDIVRRGDLGDGR